VVQTVKQNSETSPPAYSGPALFAGAYRVFFFGAALWAVTALFVWLVYLMGFASGVGANGDMLQWHAHELVFGYGCAVVVGFALTAIPNWTGRLPVRGLELALLALLWGAARIGALLLLLGYEAELVRAIAEIMFFLLFIVIAAREVIGGRNWRNLKIIGLFALLGTAVIAANLERLGRVELPMPSWQLGLAMLLLLICVVGGRVIPAFTGNWLRMQGHKKGPVMFGKFDGLAIVAAVGVLGMFLLGVSGPYFSAAALAASILHFARLSRWRGWQTLGSPIVAVLHFSYFWVPTGFFLLALAGVGVVTETAALHAWTVGGVGSTTLAVMTRASLGHAGLPLTDSPVLTSIYAAINGAAFLRVSAEVWHDQHDILVNISGVLWCVAFTLFLVRFSRLYFTRRIQGR